MPKLKKMIKKDKEWVIRELKRYDRCIARCNRWSEHHLNEFRFQMEESDYWKEMRNDFIKRHGIKFKKEATHAENDD